MNALKHYIVAALWSSTDDRGDPMDEGYNESDLAPETRGLMGHELSAFFARADAEAPVWGEFWTFEQAAHDFWLTRNGHGAGFWDRPRQDDEWTEVGEILTRLSKEFGPADLYVGDDGLIYQTPGRMLVGAA